MEQKTNVDISTEQLENSSNSAPQKKAKRQPKSQALMQLQLMTI